MKNVKYVLGGLAILILTASVFVVKTVVDKINRK